MPSDQLRVSWSMLRAFDTCHNRARLIRERKRDSGADIRMFFPGMVVDSAMRDWLRDENREPGQMAAKIALTLEAEEKRAEKNDGTVRWKGSKDKADVIALCQDAATKLEPLLEENVLPFEFTAATRFKVEATVPGLHGEERDILLTGETDIVVKDDRGQWGIWDLKVTKNEYYYKKTIAQLAFYDLALAPTHGSFSSVVGLIQPLCKTQIRAHAVSPAERAQMADHIRAYCHSVWRNESEYTEKDSNCYMCPVQKVCERERWEPVNPGRARLGRSVKEVR